MKIWLIVLPIMIFSCSSEKKNNSANKNLNKILQEIEQEIEIEEVNFSDEYAYSTLFYEGDTIELLNFEDIPDILSKRDIHAIKVNNVDQIPYSINTKKNIKVLIVNNNETNFLLFNDNHGGFFFESSYDEIFEFKPNNFVDITRLKDLPNLSFIDLSHCGIIEIPENFKSLKKLKTLFLIGNKGLKDVSNLYFVKNLILNNCGLNELPSGFQNLQQLEALYLDKNKYIYDFSDLKFLSNLKKLSLSNCDLEYLPMELQELKKLEFLNVSDNGDLIDFYSINGFNIKTLIMQNVKTEAIPAVFNTLNLSYLDLRGCNALLDFSGLRKVTTLQYLDLTDCDMTYIPEEIRHNKNMTVLKLNGNDFIRDFSILTQLTALKQLELNNCDLKEIPNEIKKLKNLNILNLANNESIDDISLLFKVSSLIELDISNCANIPESQINKLLKINSNLKIITSN